MFPCWQRDVSDCSWNAEHFDSSVRRQQGLFCRVYKVPCGRLHFVLPVGPLSLFLSFGPCYSEVGNALSHLKLLQTQSHRKECVSPLSGAGRRQRSSVSRRKQSWETVLGGGRVKPDSLPLSNHVSGPWCSFPCTLFLGSFCSCRTHRISKKFAVRTLGCIFAEERSRKRRASPRKPALEERESDLSFVVALMCLSTS